MDGYKAKNQNIDNEIILVNKDIEELKTKIKKQDDYTLEQIKNLF